MGGKSRPHQDLIPDLRARTQSLYRLSYPAHVSKSNMLEVWNFIIIIDLDFVIKSNKCSWWCHWEEQLKKPFCYMLFKFTVCSFALHNAQQSTESSTLIRWSFDYCLNYLKTNQMLSSMTECHQVLLMRWVVNTRENQVVWAMVQLKKVHFLTFPVWPPPICL